MGKDSGIQWTTHTFNPWVGCQRVSPGWLSSADGIDWVIIGGESGAKARPFHMAWAMDLVKQCRESGTAPFVKQMGSAPHLDGVRLRFRDHHGGDMAEWSENLRVREFPR